MPVGVRMGADSLWGTQRDHQTDYARGRSVSYGRHHGRHSTLSCCRDVGSAVFIGRQRDSGSPAADISFVRKLDGHAARCAFERRWQCLRRDISLSAHKR